MAKRRARTPEEIAKVSDKVQVSVRMDPEAVEYLKKRATAAGVSFSELVNEAVRSYIAYIKSNSP